MFINFKIIKKRDPPCFEHPSCLRRAELRGEVQRQEAVLLLHPCGGCVRLEHQLHHVQGSTAWSVLGFWGEPMRGAVGNKKLEKRAPFVYPKSSY